jgi:threonine aldolase
MVHTSLSKILTVSKNPQTNMFLLIVGQLRYPEVTIMRIYYFYQKGTLGNLKWILVVLVVVRVVCHWTSNVAVVEEVGCGNIQKQLLLV